MQLVAKLITKLAMNERLAEIIGQRMGRDFGCGRCVSVRFVIVRVLPA